MNKDIFYQDYKNNSFQLITKDHVLKFYFGKNEVGRYTLELRGQFKKNSLKSTGTIEIATYSRDKDCIIKFSLQDDCLFDTFVVFCNDVIIYTEKAIDQQSGFNLLCNRYYVWRKMFSSQKEILSDEEIKGLLGELLFLRDEMIPMYGVTMALQAWSGQDKTKKDFSINDTWYEIKTIDFGKSSVGISSLEQLESETDGELCVFQLERMSEMYKGLTLNNLFDSILSILKLQMDIDLFTEKMVKAGYAYSTEYDTKVFDYKRLDRYKVNNEFPRLSHSNMPTAVIKAKYEIELSKIENYILKA